MGHVKALINHAHEGKIISKNENRILSKEGESTGKVHERSPKCKVVVIPFFLALVEALSAHLWQRAVGRERLLPSRLLHTLVPSVTAKIKTLNGKPRRRASIYTKSKFFSQKHQP